MKLYAVNVRPLQDEVVFNRLLFKASPERRKMTLAYKSEKSRALSLGAELLLFYAVRKENPGIKLPPEYNLGLHNKPYFKGMGGLYFNLSHSGDYAACIIGKEEVGVDIEQITTASKGVAKKCFTEFELNSIMREDGKPEEDAFFTYWTLKESFLKAIGKGFNLAPTACEIVMGYDTITVRQNYNEKLYYCRLYETIPGYKLAVCSADINLPDNVILTAAEELES